MLPHSVPLKVACARVIYRHQPLIKQSMMQLIKRVLLGTMDATDQNASAKMMISSLGLYSIHREILRFLQYLEGNVSQ